MRPNDDEASESTFILLSIPPAHPLASTGRRHHTGNRLFILLYADDGQHWKLKADVSSIAKGIHRYLDAFDPCQLHQIDNGAKADVIWYMD